MNVTDLTPEEIIAQSKVDAFIVVLYENQKTLSDLPYRLDWRMEGILTEYTRKGWITGGAGECTWIPTPQQHLLIIGGGPAQKEFHLSDSSLRTLKKNFSQMGIKKIGISKSNLNAQAQSVFKNILQGVEVWITP